MTVLPERFPGFHVYELAPVAVSVVVCPEHAGLVAVTDTEGGPDTFTVLVSVEEQFPVRPVTVYTVIETGDTLIVAVVKLPGIHV